MEESIYSRVISRRGPGGGDEDLVNSYRFKRGSMSPNRSWSPRVGEEDRFKKKREREDQYIKAIEPANRPVIVVKKKQVFDGLVGPGVEMNPQREERYYKRTENTRGVDDVDFEISTQSSAIKRETTFVHSKSLGAPEEETQMIKLDGVEFLPEGFLELDPLLYKNEYIFDNRMTEKMFDADQRRQKALRRKQYEMKNRQKVRDVTIFVVDEYRDKILGYLEQWYMIHKRRMDEEELENTAHVFNCPLELVEELQNLYLKKSRLANERKIRDYMADTTLPRERKISKLPVSLQKYFMNFQPPKQVYRSPSPKPEKLSRTTSQVNLNKSQALFEQYDQRISAIIKEIRDRNVTNPGHLSSITMPQEPSSRSIRGLSTRGTGRSISPSLGRTVSTSQVISSSVVSDSEPQKVRVVARSTDGNYAVIHKLKPSLVGNELFFQKVEQLQSRNSNLIFLITKDDAGEERARQELEEIAEGYINQVVAEEGRGLQRKVTIAVLNDKGETVAVQNHRTSQINQVFDVEFETKEEPLDRLGRKTTVAVSTNGDETTIATRVRPTLLGAQYYSQIIVENVDSESVSAKLLTLDEEGNTISVVPIAPEHLSKTYFTNVVNEYLADKVREFEIETRNEKNAIVSRQTIRQTLTGEFVGNYFTDVIEEVIDSMGVKRITIYRLSKANQLEIVRQAVETNPRASSKRSIVTQNAKEEFQRLLSEANAAKPFSLPQERPKENSVDTTNKKKTTISRLSDLPRVSNQSRDILHSSADEQWESHGSFQRNASQQHKPSNSLKQTQVVEGSEHEDQEELQKALSKVRMFEEANITGGSKTSGLRAAGWNPFNADGSANQGDLLKESIQLNNHLEEYIRTLKSHQGRSHVDAGFWEKLRQVFREEMKTMSDDLLQKLNKNTLSRSTFNDQLLDEFYQFCQNRLPEDQDYKESVLFTSMFYYFMEKQKGKLF